MQTVQEPITTQNNPLIKTEYNFKTNSSLMHDIYQKVSSLTRLDKHLILIGEIGVGKNCLARAIHQNSRRANGPFYSYYCMNSNEEEFKDSFWEHVHVEDNHFLLKYDVLEKASNGILYLNKFSELSAEFKQNIIDSYIFGCNQLFRYNFATSPRLIISVSQDTFEQFSKTATWHKLLALLNPISLMLPPLRERQEDVPAFIELFIHEAKMSEPSWYRLGISDAAMQECIAYKWPGNIRQLKNAVFQGALLSEGTLIDCKHLPFSMNWQLPYKDD